MFQHTLDRLSRLTPQLWLCFFHPTRRRQRRLRGYFEQFITEQRLTDLFLFNPS
jgi:hypothetical protein